MIIDIRGYFDFLEERGFLDRYKDEITLEAIPKHLKLQEKKGNAIIYENIKDYEYPLFSNVFGKRDFLAAYFGCSIEEVVDVFKDRMEQRISPVYVDDAPVQEVVLKKGEFDIRDFPFLTHSQRDVGRYITAGVIIAKDPETGIRNLSFNRLQLKGADKTGLRMSPTQDLETYYRKAVRLNQPLEVAVVIGSHPMCLLSAACGPPRDVDELDIAGALRQKPIEIVKCKSIDVEVPAFAEVVLEGKLFPSELEEEGPFGDFQGYYIEEMKNHVFHIECVTMRKNPMIQVIAAGSTDDVTLLGSSREAQIKKQLESMNIEVTGINIMLCGNYLTCVIAIRKQIDYIAKNALMAAFGSFSFLKTCIIVDHDVDVFDLSDIFWALSTRLNADTGLLVVPHTAGFGRDKHGIHTTKLGIDATVPLDAWDDFERVTVFDPDTKY